MPKTDYKRPPKTQKEYLFANEYLATGNATEAASRTYKVKNRQVARSLGSQNLAKLSFSEYFDHLGLNNQKLVTSLVQATKATKHTASGKVPDWNNRIKALELCMRLKGTFQLTEKQHQAPESTKELEKCEFSPAMENLLTRHFTNRIKRYQNELKDAPEHNKTDYQEVKSKIIKLFQMIQGLEPRLFETETIGLSPNLNANL